MTVQSGCEAGRKPVFVRSHMKTERYWSMHSFVKPKRQKKENAQDMHIHLAESMAIAQRCHERHTETGN